MRRPPLVRERAARESDLLQLGRERHAAASATNPTLTLTPRKTRPENSASAIAQQLRGVLQPFPQFRGGVNVPQSLQIGGFRGDSSYNLMVQSANTEDLPKWTPRLMDAIAPVVARMSS